MFEKSLKSINIKNKIHIVKKVLIYAVNRINKTDSFKLNDIQN